MKCADCGEEVSQDQARLYRQSQGVLCKTCEDELIRQVALYTENCY